MQSKRTWAILQKLMIKFIRNTLWWMLIPIFVTTSGIQTGELVLRRKAHERRNVNYWEKTREAMATKAITVTKTVFKTAKEEAMLFEKEFNILHSVLQQVYFSFEACCKHSQGIFPCFYWTSSTILNFTFHKQIEKRKRRIISLHEMNSAHPTVRTYRTILRLLSPSRKTARSQTALKHVKLAFKQGRQLPPEQQEKELEIARMYASYLTELKEYSVCTLSSLFSCMHICVALV